MKTKREKIFETIIDQARKEMEDAYINGKFTPGGFTAPPDPAVHFNCRHEPIYSTGDLHRSMSNNHFKSGKVYHKDGSVTEWRNYAIIKTEEREFKAPVLMEGR